MVYNKTMRQLLLHPAARTYLAGAVLIAFFAYIYGFDTERFKPETIRDLIISWGYWGPLGYIALNALRPFFLFPAMLVGVAGGLAFGPLQGALYLIAGTAAGAALCFAAARLLGSGRVQRCCGQWLTLGQLEQQLAEHGFKTVLLLRLAPVLPWDAVSFMAGLSRMRFWPYFAATVVGSIPGAIVFTWLGDSLSRSLASAAIFAAALAVLAAFYYYGKRYQQSSR
ncbi:MAG: TVP38/TMEM64 family protein [Sporomusaceae bacterium]|nr:TVP38/TMEM64 family protein [Sporomusaceae bacterium]